MRKEVRNNFILFLGLILLLSIGFVAAQQGAGGGQGPLSDLGGFVENAFEFIQPGLEAAFGAPMNIDSNAPVSSDYIARIMFFTLIFALLWITLSKIDFIADNTIVLWVVVIASTFLSTRWLSSEIGGRLVQTLLLPYDTLGLSLAAFLPLIIYFIFLDVGFSGRKYRTIRRSGWIFFLVIFTFLWITRAPELVTATANYAGLVYPISALLCLVFFFFDRTIQTFFAKTRVDAAKAVGARNKAITLQEKREKLHQIWTGNASSDAEKKNAKREMDKIDDELIKLEAI